MEINKLDKTKESFLKYYTHFEDFLNLKVGEIELNKSDLYKMYANSWNYEQDEIDYLEHIVYTEGYEFDVEFRLTYRNSIIIQLYSIMENILRNYCLKHYIENKKEYSINDIKGNNDIDKIKKYLKNSSKIDITKNQKLWDFINNFRKLRNKLVHNEGIIHSKENDFKSLLEFSNEKFIITKKVEQQEGAYTIILFDEGFIYETINNVFDFIEQIISE